MSKKENENNQELEDTISPIPGRPIETIIPGINTQVVVTTKHEKLNRVRESSGGTWLTTSLLLLILILLATLLLREFGAI